MGGFGSRNPQFRERTAEIVIFAGSKYRPWQFSLGMLLIVTTAVAGLLSRSLRHAERQAMLVRKIEMRRGRAGFERRDSLLGALLSSRPSGLSRELNRELTEVYLRTRDADDELVSQICRVRPLTLLDVSQTAITDRGLKQLHRLTNLRVLDVGRNAVSDASLQGIASLRYLRHLNLGQTDITDAGLIHVAKLPDLKSLGLFGDRITDNGLRTIEGLTSLESLDLGGTQVTDAGLASLLALPQLTRVRLAREPDADGAAGAITDEGLATLAQIPGLRYLELNNQSITDRGLELLEAVSSLRYLNLFSVQPQYTEEGQARLQRALPQLTIHHAERGEPEVEPKTGRGG